MANCGIFQFMLHEYLSNLHGKVILWSDNVALALIGKPMWLCSIVFILSEIQFFGAMEIIIGSCTDFTNHVCKRFNTVLGRVKIFKCELLISLLLSQTMIQNMGHWKNISFLHNLAKMKPNRFLCSNVHFNLINSWSAHYSKGLVTS